MHAQWDPAAVEVSLRRQAPASAATSLAHAGIGLFLLGFFCALVQLPLGMSAGAFGSHNEIMAVAHNLAVSGEFRDPFGTPTGYTAHVAPVYPFILAALIGVLRHPTLIACGAMFLNACLLGFAAGMLPTLSQSIYARTAPGIAGGILLALSSRLMPQWEASLSAALLLAAAMAILDRGAVRAGLWSGVCLLANPVALPVLVLMVARRGWRFAAGVSLLALSVCAPWCLRNWIVIGAPYFVRDNLGLELYISNNDQAAPQMMRNASLWTQHPSQNPREAELVAAMGEGPYNRMRLHNALDWMASHASRSLQLALGRMRDYWFPDPDEGWASYCVCIITILSAVGAYIGRRNRKSALLAIATVVYSLPFLLLQTADRYRAPCLWMSALLAGYSLDGMTFFRQGQPRLRS